MSSVLKISEAASLGLHAMIMLARSNGNLLSVKDISEELDVSANHLSKVMQRLVKSGLVVSIKGFKGGFKLTKEAGKVTFLEIYEAIDGKFAPAGCLLNKDSCQGWCIMGGLVQSINKQVRDYFSKTTLADYLNSEKQAI